MEQQRQFRGVWIPKEIWDSEELSINEKALLVEIDSLEDEDKGCWASNKHFSDFLKVSNGRISQLMNSLKDKGYLKIEYERNGKEIICRHIFINRPPYPEVFNNLNGVFRKLNRGIKNSKEGYLENCKESNTYLNNTNLNNTKENICFKDIVEYLNLKTNSNYKYTTNKTKELIRARFNEGFTTDDFKTVIDNMSQEWINDNKMKMYLRPETLFGTKFESYLNRPKRELTTKDLEKFINVEEVFL